MKWFKIRWLDNPKVWTCYKFNLDACFDQFLQQVCFINYYDEKMDVLNVCLGHGGHNTRDLSTRYTYIKSSQTLTSISKHVVVNIASNVIIKYE